MSWRPIS